MKIGWHCWYQINHRFVCDNYQWSAWKRQKKPGLENSVVSLKKTWGRTTVRLRVNTSLWKTWPLWKKEKLQLSKTIQENAFLFKWEILNWWREYCLELYNHEASGDPSVLKCFQTDKEDDHPILHKEVEAAVQSLKSAGVDNIQQNWSKQMEKK